MKRDTDLLRSMLLACEEGPEPTRWISDVYGDEDEVHYGFTNSLENEHFRLLLEAKLVEEVFDGQDETGRGKFGYRLTWLGHDYIAAIRSDTIWETTKRAVAQVGGTTLAVMVELAVGYGKQEAKRKLGL